MWLLHAQGVLRILLFLAHRTMRVVVIVVVVVVVVVVVLLL